MSGKIYFADLPLRSESSRVSAFYNSNYMNALEKDLTDKMHEELKIVAKSKLNLILSWFGLQGYGKSFSMLNVAESLAKYKGLSLKIENVNFTITDMLNTIQNMARGDIAILDEQVGSANLGSSVERMALNNIEMTVRAHQLNLFFAAPNFITHKFHYFFEVWQFGASHPIDFDIPIENQWEYTKLVMYNHKEQMMGYIITKTPNDKKFLKEYDKKKDAFIDEARSQTTSKRHETLMQDAYTLINDDEFLEKFVLLRTKRLKELHIRVSLKGKLYAGEETKTICDYIDYLCEFENDIKDKVDNIRKNYMKKRKQKIKESSVPKILEE